MHVNVYLPTCVLQRSRHPKTKGNEALQIVLSETDIILSNITGGSQEI